MKIGIAREKAQLPLGAAPLDLFDICDYPIILCEMGSSRSGAVFGMHLKIFLLLV